MNREDSQNREKSQNQRLNAALPFACPSSIDITRLHHHLGAIHQADGSTRFAVFAPGHESLDLLIQCGHPSNHDRVAMTTTSAGFHLAHVNDCPPGTKYQFATRPLPDSRSPTETGLPDPASRFQPGGVHGPSEVVKRDFAWSDQGWSGIRREDVVLYELHVGAFSEKGTFASAMNRLEELVELGITALEIMPVNECAGRWNWGYDGVDWFAPMSSLGTPDDFRRFVDRAHQLGLAVLLDVVYNHFGPEGNYLHGFGGYVSQRHHTTWGDAPNTDEAPTDVATRRFVVANALHWLDEYHLDGLRVDAIHCIADDSEPHLVRQMSEAIAEWSRSVQRQVLLVAESNVYDPEMLTPLKGGGMGFDAQWCDDFLHSVFAVVRPGEQLSHRPYLSKSDLSQVLTKGFVYEGTVRRERERKHPETRVDTRGLIYSIQNHDFIGNHPLGQRFHQLTCPATQRAAAALLILSPAIPMIFMGEEFACENPFSFFVDFGDDQLREAVVEGRKAEYPQHDWTNGVLPIDPDAFTSSKIGPTNAGSQGMLAWYQALIRIRREWIAAGVLSDHSLRVETFPDQDIHRLTYQTSTRTCGVSVRLGTPESAAPGHGPIGHAKRIDSSQSRYRNSDEPESSNQAIVFDTPAVT